MPTIGQSLVIVAVVSYLLGSIPFGYLLVRMFRGEDVRKSGSGNIGATNVARKSPVLGVLTLVLDAVKGSFAVWLTYRSIGLAAGNSIDLDLYPFVCAAGLFAVVGHMFPVWLRFRGGKGVATALGSFVLIAPTSVLIVTIFFIIIVALTRYVSLGSIVAVAIFPIAVWRLHEYRHELISLVFMATASLLIIVKHRQNIARLLAGTENRFGQKRSAPDGEHSA